MRELKHEEYMVLFKLVPRTFEEGSLLLVLYFIIILFCFCFLFLLFQTRVLCISKRQPFFYFFSFSVFHANLPFAHGFCILRFRLMLPYWPSTAVHYCFTRGIQYVWSLYSDLVFVYLVFTLLFFFFSFQTFYF